MKVAVISGASGGIGAATATLFAEAGYKVYGLSRRKGNDKRVQYISTDVSDEMSVQAAFKQIADESGEVDILINNAGMGISGAVETTELEMAKRQFDVNLFGMFCCVKYALPLMRAAGGRIVNISSVAATFSVPFQAFYSASKAAINSVTMALRSELKQFGISVCAVMPGDVSTGFTVARVKNAGSEIYAGSVERSVAVMEKDEQNGMTPEFVAKLIFKVSGKKTVRPFYVAGFKYRVFCLLGKLLPVRTVSFIVSKMYVK